MSVCAKILASAAAAAQFKRWAQMQHSAGTSSSSLAYVGVASILAAIFGAVLGAAMSWAVPGSKLTLVGLLAAPLWLLVEFLFEFIGVLGEHHKSARVPVAIAASVGFYVALYALQSSAP
jgi:hypothetical protein